MKRLRARAGLAVSTMLAAAVSLASAGGGLASIRTEDLKEWLTYIASDELQGRDTYSAGLGLAAGYIQQHLGAWGVKPAGDNQGYLQTVSVLGVKTRSRSSVVVTVGNETRTFKDGEGVTFPRNQGGNQTLTVDRVEFAGYGLDARASNQKDYLGASAKGSAVVWLGATGPRGLDQARRRLLAGRHRYAIDQMQAAASIGAESPPSGGGRRRRGRATALAPKRPTSRPRSGSICPVRRV
jgi:hypothetical protein